MPDVDIVESSSPGAARQGAQPRLRLAVGGLLLLGLVGCGSSGSGDVAAAPSSRSPVGSSSAAPSVLVPTPDIDPGAPAPPEVAADIGEGRLLTASDWPAIEGWQPWREVENPPESQQITWSCSSADLPAPVETLTRTVSGPDDDGQIGYVTVTRYAGPDVAATVQQAMQKSVLSCTVEPAPYAGGTFQIAGTSGAFHAEGLVRPSPDVPVEGLGFAQAQLGDAIVSVLMAQADGPAPSQAQVEATLEAAVRQAVG